VALGGRCEQARQNRSGGGGKEKEEKEEEEEEWGIGRYGKLLSGG